MMSLFDVKQNRVSVIIPTRDRPTDLTDLLLTILDQDYLPFEVIIVDDSLVASARKVVDSLNSRLESHNSPLKFIKGSNDGLPAARNLGIKNSGGDFVLFLDDDTLLDRNAVSSLAIFLRDNPTAIGVQPRILSPTGDCDDLGPAKKLENAIYKVFMLTYDEQNKLAVRRSGASVFPSVLTKVISAQRLSGCCCCWRREIFKQQLFDTNLKGWAFMEDLDFSQRAYMKNPQSLFATPDATIIHKSSQKARRANETVIYMTTIYWFYVFLKDVFDSSALNLVAFIWALTGTLLSNVGGLIIKKKPKGEWWGFIYLVSSYFYAFKHIREIMRRHLDFFNKQPNK